MLRPTLWPYALAGFYGQGGGGGGMPWAGWDAKRCGPPFFLHNIYDMYMHACLACSTVCTQTGAEPQSVAIYLLKFSTQSCAELNSISCWAVCSNLLKFSTPTLTLHALPCYYIVSRASQKRKTGWLTRLATIGVLVSPIRKDFAIQQET